MFNICEGDSINDEKKNTTPYNLNNRFITKEEVENIFKSYNMDIKINNIEIYQQAFVHKSYCKKKDSIEFEIEPPPENCLDLQPNSNERLEFIGDAVISSACANYLYERFQSQDEGFLTRIRTKIVNGESLANLAEKLGFTKYILISKHVEEKTSGRENMRILEDAFESFIGAVLLDFNNIDIDDVSETIDSLKVNIKLINEKKKELLNNKVNKDKKIIDELYLIIDKFEGLIKNIPSNLNNIIYTGIGYQIAETLFINIIEKNLYWPDLILKDSNYKDQLLRYFQQHFQNTPKYIEQSVDGPAHSRYFTMSVLGMDGIPLGTGRERSKKKAEQLASKEALIKLGAILNSERFIKQ